MQKLPDENKYPGGLFLQPDNRRSREKGGTSYNPPVKRKI